MTEPAFIPGRRAPRRRLHPAAWTAAGFALALVLGGGAWLLTRPAGTPTQTVDTRRAQAISLCESSIRGQLKSPASAQFSGESYSAGAVVYTVTGAVDAQNGFGAMLRDRWECTLVETNGVLSVALATLHDDN